jgi:hypothetical protein
MTVDECRRLLHRLGVKHGVPGHIIARRLLSDEDKNDMLQGLLTAETLDYAIGLWKEYGMCDYANGSGAYYEHFRAYQGLAKG